jgi:hypothetical protein
MNAPTCQLTGGTRQTWLANAAPAWIALPALALAITIGQIGLACLLSGQARLADGYARLFSWDSGCYGHIVDHGYLVPEHLTQKDNGNVAFFPGYPLFAGLLRYVLGLTTPRSLLLAAQLGCWAFWTYFLLFLRRWQAPIGLTALAVLLVVLHPASFFLVAAYSEPLFLASLLGFLYWADKDSLVARTLASAHGFVMTATRLVGLPLVVAPLCMLWLGRGPDRWRRIIPRALVGVAASLGALAYFGYCQYRFGAWDIYMQAEAIGWGVQPNFLALLSPRVLHINWPGWKEGFIDPEFLSRLSVPATLMLFGGFYWLERRNGFRSWRERVIFYFCGAVMFYICVSGHASRGMSSMLRFVLCVQVMLVLAGAHLLLPSWPADLRARWPRRLLAGWCLLMLALQLAMTWRFVHGKWVA